MDTLLNYYALCKHSNIEIDPEAILYLASHFVMLFEVLGGFIHGTNRHIKIYNLLLLFVITLCLTPNYESIKAFFSTFIRINLFFFLNLKLII